MSYSAKLINKINTLNDIDTNLRSFVSPVSNLSLNNLIAINNKIKNDDDFKSKLNIMRDYDYSKSFFDIISYLSNNKDLFNKLLEKDKEYLETVVDSMAVLNLDEFLFFNEGVLGTLFEKNSKLSWSTRLDEKKLRMLLNYCLKNGYKDIDNVLKILSIYIKLSCMRNTKYIKSFSESVDYILENELTCCYEKALEKCLDERIVIEDEKTKEYLRFLYDNDVVIYSYYNISKLLKADNLSEKLKVYNEIKEILKDKNLYIYHVIRVFEDFNFSLKEMNTFLYKIKNEEMPSELVDILKSSYNNNSTELFNCILKFIYPNYIDISKAFISIATSSDLIHYALKNNKKKFLKTLTSIDCKSIGRYHSLNKKEIFEVLNLNLLTKEDILKIGEYNNEFPDIYRKVGLKNMSMNEFNTIINLSSLQQILYSKLLDLKSDDRLRIIKEIPRDLSGIKDEISKLSLLLKEKSLNQRINELSANIEKVKGFKLSKLDWLKYILIDNLDAIKSQAKKETDVKFIINHYKELLDMPECSFNLVKKDIFFNSATYRDFIVKTDLNDNFVRDNQESLYDFYISGLMDIFLIYFRSINFEYRTNLINITKAHLSDMLSDIKFFKDDLKKEISFDIDEKKESIWKDNARNSSSKFITEETYDYETIIKLGEIPVSSCMSYNGGGYNHCLLSNFDANKKILLVRNAETDDIVARAIFRLSKLSSDNRIINHSDFDNLAFRDVENLASSNKIDNDKEEELVLFLERCYTNYHDREVVENELIKLAYKKAKILGIRLVISDSYRGEYKFIKDLSSDLVAQSKGYIFISKSKNGTQYLDSFGGSTTNNESNYISCSRFMTLLQEGMFNPELEYKIQS